MPRAPAACAAPWPAARCRRTRRCGARGSRTKHNAVSVSGAGGGRCRRRGHLGQAARASSPPRQAGTFPAHCIAPVGDGLDATQTCASFLSKQAQPAPTCPATFPAPVGDGLGAGHGRVELVAVLQAHAVKGLGLLQQGRWRAACAIALRTAPAVTEARGQQSAMVTHLARRRAVPAGYYAAVGVARRARRGPHAAVAAGRQVAHALGVVPPLADDLRVEKTRAALATVRHVQCASVRGALNRTCVLGPSSVSVGAVASTCVGLLSAAWSAVSIGTSPAPHTCARGEACFLKRTRFGFLCGHPRDASPGRSSRRAARPRPHTRARRPGTRRVETCNTTRRATRLPEAHDLPR